MFIIPYFLRSFRLYQVFKAHNKHFMLKKKKGVFAFKRVKSLYCVREGNLIKWLAIVMIPFLIFTVAAITSKTFRINLFPAFESPFCMQDPSHYIEFAPNDYYEYEYHLFFTIEFYLFLNFMLDLALVSAIYALRHVQDEFSINLELKIVSVTWIVLGFI